MKNLHFYLKLAGLFALAGCVSASTQRNTSSLPPAATKHWTADNGNGTYSNPLFYGEFEDPDPIRVGNDYYLAGTTMHMNPAVEILHSKDLVNWELAGYCTNRLDLGPAYRLEGGNIYGSGIWAPCIRYHNGMFYIFCNVNGAGLQVFRSKSIYGPWEHNQLPGTGTTCPFSLMMTWTRSSSSPAAAAPIPLRNFRRTSGPLTPTPPSINCVPPGAKDGRRPSPLQDQGQVLRRFRHARRSRESDGRRG